MCSHTEKHVYNIFCVYLCVLYVHPLPLALPPFLAPFPNQSNPQATPLAQRDRLPAHLWEI